MQSSQTIQQFMVEQSAFNSPPLCFPSTHLQFLALIMPIGVAEQYILVITLLWHWNLILLSYFTRARLLCWDQGGAMYGQLKRLTRAKS